MDSIVDSFFPFLEEIEQEIINIENLIFSDDNMRLHQQIVSDIALEPSVSNSDTLVSHGSFDEKDKEKDSSPSLKPEERSIHRMQFAVPSIQRRPPIQRARLLSRRLSLMVSHVKSQVNQPRKMPAPNTVHRVAHVRRLVTSLSRFLATKSEVVAQVKKRILMTGEHGLGNGTGDDRDVFVYMGDVQGMWPPICAILALPHALLDHILTLQQSLAHYERMLSQSHPTYLTHLRLSVSKSKAGSDKAILYLTVISLAVLCMQAVIGGLPAPSPCWSPLLTVPHQVSSR